MAKAAFLDFIIEIVRRIDHAPDFKILPRRWVWCTNRGGDVRDLALTDQGMLTSEDEPSRRFAVALFIVHPTLSPAEITAALGLQAHFEHPVGEPRRTPQGTPLPGTYRDTRWRHSVRYDVKDQWFADRLTDFVGRLIPHKAFLAHLRSTGGKASVIVAFLGDDYFGDEVPFETMRKLVELGLDLGLECFNVPQS